MHYPLYDSETNTQYFPFKTFSMLSSLFCCIGGSLFVKHLFKSGRLQPEWDILNCIVNIDSAQIVLPTDTSFNVSCETLAMQRLRSTDGTSDNNGHILFQDSELSPNKPLTSDINGTKCNLTARSEHTALYPNGQQYHDYLAIVTVSR